MCQIHDAARILELRLGHVDERAFRPMRDVAEDDEFFDSETLVALVGSEVTGFVSWNDDYVTWLYVDPNFHRQGIGRDLLEAALEHMGPQAWTNTIPENTPAINLYQSVGFQLVWVRPSECEGFPCNTARLALPSSRMFLAEARAEDIGLSMSSQIHFGPSLKKRGSQ